MVYTTVKKPWISFCGLEINDKKKNLFYYLFTNVLIWEQFYVS